MTSYMTTIQNPEENSSLKVYSAARVTLFSKICWPQYQRFICMKFPANDPRN